MQSGSSSSDSLRRPLDSLYNNSFESNPLGAGGSDSRTIWPLGSHAMLVNRPGGIGNRRWRSSTNCGTSLGGAESLGASDGEQATAIASRATMPTSSRRSMDVRSTTGAHIEERQPSSTPSISAAGGSFCTPGSVQGWLMKGLATPPHRLARVIWENRPKSWQTTGRQGD